MKTFIALIVAILLLSNTVYADSLNALFTIDKKAIPQTVLNKLQEYGCEWIIAHIGTNRILVDMVLPNKAVAFALKDYLIANDYNPKLISLTKFDGVNSGQEKDGEGNVTGVPDVVIDVSEYQVVTETNIQLHKFMGWTDRIFE